MVEIEMLHFSPNKGLVADSYQDWRGHIRDARPYVNEHNPGDADEIASYVQFRLSREARSLRYHGGFDPEYLSEKRRRHFIESPPSDTHILKVFVFEGRIRGVCHAELMSNGLGEIGVSVGDVDLNDTLAEQSDFRHSHVGHALLDEVIQAARKNKNFLGLYSSSSRVPEAKPMKYLASVCGFEYDLKASCEAGEDVLILRF